MNEIELKDLYRDDPKNLVEFFPGTIFPGRFVVGKRSGIPEVVLGYDLGGHVPPRSPNLDPVLKRICNQKDSPF